MAAAGVRAVVEPAFWLGQPRTNPGSFADYFDSLIGWEPFRAAQFGIRHHATIALNPKEANDPRCRGVLDLLPRYLDKDGVVAVGEIGYDSMTPAEDEVFAAQLALAVEYELPALVHTPHRDKAAGTRRTLDVVEESGIDAGPGAGRPPQRGHRRRWSRDSGCWMGFSIYPETKMSPPRMVEILKRVRPRADAGELGRRLGHVRSAAHRAPPARRCWPPGSPPTTSTWCCGATRSSSTASPAGSTSPTADAGGHLRGQLDPARGGS